MSLHSVTKFGCLLAAFLLVQTPVFGATRQCAPPQAAMTSSPCPCSQNSQAAATWDFPKEASRLLQDINRDSRQVRYTADRLVSQYPGMQVDWRVQSDELSIIKSEVNRMGQDLCRLQTIDNQLMPWQRKAVQSTAPLLKELSIFTTDAIEFGNDHQSTLWSPTYRTFMRDIYTDARQVPRAVKSEG